MATKDPNAYNNFLKSQTVDDIEKMYQSGDITAKVYHNRLRAKAKLELSELEQGSPFISAVLQQSAKNIMEGWKTVVENSTKIDTESNLVSAVAARHYSELKAIGGMMQMVGAFLGSGLSDVFGMRVENNALKQGYSPGAAHVFGTIAGIGTGMLVPVGQANKAATTAASATAKAVGLGEKIANAGVQREEAFLRAMAEGLAIDGVDNAAKVVAKSAKSAGVDIAIGEGASATTKAAETMSFVEEAKQIGSGVTEQVARAALPPLMKKLGVSWPDLKSVYSSVGRAPYTAQQFYGYLSALQKRSTELGALAEAAIAPNATMVEQTAFAKAATDLFTGGAGDKLTYTKDFIDLLVHWDPKSVASGDLATAMKTFATDMARAAPPQLAKGIFKSQQGFINYGKIWPAVKEGFVNILLPLASVPAFVGNSIGTANIILERALSGHAVEAAYGMKGLAWAFGDAMRSVGRVYATGGTRGTIPGVLGRAVRAPGDTMMAMDAFFKVVDMRASLYMDGLNAGMTGSNLTRFVANPPITALENAAERAYRATYQNDLGQFLSKWAPLARSGPGSFYFAFIKSPINLVKYAWDRTPGLQMISGRLWHDIAEGGTLASDAWARLTMSQLQAMMVWEFAKDGLINGSGPIGELRRPWNLTHKPYTINARDGMVAIGNLDPITMPIMLVADIAQIADQLDEATLGQLSAAAAFAFMQNVGNRTAWRQMSDLVEVVQGRQDGEKWSRRDTQTLAAPLVSMATGGSLVQRIEGITDPVQRDARNLYEDILRRVPIPGYSEGVAPMRNGLGDVVFPPTTPGTPWFGFFSPLVPKVSPYTDDPIAKEAARLSAKLPYFPDYIGSAPPPDPTDPKMALTPLPPGKKYGVPLTSAQRDRWQQLYSNVIRHSEEGLGRLINSPEYKAWPLARQRDEFNAAVLEAKSFAKDNLLLEDKDLAKKLAINEMQSELPRELPENRPAVQQSYEQELTLIDQLTPIQLENVTKYGVMEPDQEKTQPGFDIMGMPVQPRTYVPTKPMTNIKVVP